MVKTVEEQIPNKVKDSKKFQEKQKIIFEEFWTKKPPTGYRSYEKGSLNEKIHLQEMERLRLEKAKEPIESESEEE